MQAAIDMDGFAGGEGKGAAGQGGDRATDILALAPARDRREPAGDFAIIGLLDRRGHLGANHSGANLVDHDAVRRKAQGEERGHHRDTGFRDAVFTAIDRGQLRIDRGDVDDRTPPAIARPRRRRDHQPGDPLGEEERPAQIDADDAVPAFDARLEEVASDRDLHAGIVDQAIDAAEGFPRRAHQRLVPGKLADIAAQEHRLAAARFDAGQRVADGLVLDDVVDDDVEPVIGQRPADRPADATAAAGDEGGGTLAHAMITLSGTWNSQSSTSPGGKQGKGYG